MIHNPFTLSRLECTLAREHYKGEVLANWYRTGFIISCWYYEKSLTLYSIYFLPKISTVTLPPSPQKGKSDQGQSLLGLASSGMHFCDFHIKILIFLRLNKVFKVDKIKI